MRKIFSVLESLNDTQQNEKIPQLKEGFGLHPAKLEGFKAPSMQWSPYQPTTLLLKQPCIAERWAIMEPLFLLHTYMPGGSSSCMQLSETPHLVPCSSSWVVILHKGTISLVAQHARTSQAGVCQHILLNLFHVSDFCVLLPGILLYLKYTAQPSMFPKAVSKVFICLFIVDMYSKSIKILKIAFIVFEVVHLNKSLLPGFIRFIYWSPLCCKIV